MTDEQTTDDGTGTGDAGGEATPPPEAPPVEVSVPSTNAEPPADAPKMFDEKYVKQLRDEAATHRTKAKEAADAAKQELAQQIGKALGLVEDETPPNPDDLLKQLSSKDSDLRQKTVELALYRTAATAGADAEGLLDSRRFMAKVDALDTSSTTFAADLASAITEAVTADPKLATAGPVPERSGGEITGGSGERHTTNPENDSIEEHRKARRKRRGLE